MEHNPLVTHIVNATPYSIRHRVGIGLIFGAGGWLLAIVILVWRL